MLWVDRVGEDAPAMKKGQVTAHKSEVGALFRVGPVSLIESIRFSDLRVF